MREGLSSTGICTAEEKNVLTVTGGKPIGAEIDSHNDHRIAMAFSLLGMVTGETVIGQAECVNKTYPEFWEVLSGLGGKVKLDEK